jgi:hypothetical protein
MKDFPPLLILTNRGHLVAYRPTESGHLELIDSLEPMEGNVKISDLVTDQAETFPTDGPGTSAYESMPLIDELEIRSLRQIAGKMEEILEREEPASWGFSAKSVINQAILELLPDECLENLSINLKLDLTNSPPVGVRSRFEEEL